FFSRALHWSTQILHHLQETPGPSGCRLDLQWTLCRSLFIPRLLPNLPRSIQVAVHPDRETFLTPPSPLLWRRVSQAAPTILLPRELQSMRTRRAGSTSWIPPLSRLQAPPTSSVH